MIITFNGTGLVTTASAQKEIPVLMAQMQTARNKWENEGKPQSCRDM